ncbi:Periplasmic dipeptide transport protein precursor [Roseovarius litorisediminis]|uniref:Periplasmic dipeptide transport protein n=1 Tax=Roseovarius litorisediminis TaxID=1312363 RepID=A0A1Y5S4T3_9RHOB|nr:ABC transporter substrate-binding protein [Roseovarius litorisediminis]SLN29796.1 Periplasmic dipeptide transport protein precursor [Roseovarius litorisediminis]
MDKHEKHAKWLIGQVETGRMSRREFLGRTSALGMALSVGTGLFNQAHAATPKKGGHMRLAMGHGATSDTLDPATLTNGLQWVVAYGVANTLTELDAAGNLAPSLATEWSSSPDAATWTFRLREGVEFHNGKTMTAEDVIASINYHRGEESTSVGKPVMASVTDIKADGPNVVVFTLSEGNADFPFNFNEATFGIYPASDNGIDWKAGGSGGYILKSEKPGETYQFERNLNYWKEGAAHADTIELHSMTDPGARTNALITGDVDCIDRIEPKVISLLSRNAGIIIEEGAGPLHYTFPMLTKVAPFDNLEMRKALKFAINRQEIVDKILFGHGVIGNDHPIGPSYRYHASDIEQNSYDPDKARHHWHQSGLGDITIDLSASDAAYSGALDTAVLFQASAKQAGININVVREPNDGYWSDVWMKKPWCASYWGGYATEDNMFTTGFAPGAAWNDTQWDHPRFNELLGAARAELNETLRAEMYREMQIILRDEGGNIVPMFANEVHARNDKIGHGDLSWSRGFDGRRILERWWMV